MRKEFYLVLDRDEEKWNIIDNVGNLVFDREEFEGEKLYNVELVHGFFKDNSIFYFMYPVGEKFFENDKHIFITKNGFYQVRYHSTFNIDFLRFGTTFKELKNKDLGLYSTKIFGFFKTGSYFGFEYPLNYQQIRDIILFLDNFKFKKIPKKYLDFLAVSSDCVYAERKTFSYLLEYDSRFPYILLKTDKEKSNVVCEIINEKIKDFETITEDEFVEILKKENMI